MYVGSVCSEAQQLPINCYSGLKIMPLLIAYFIRLVSYHEYSNLILSLIFLLYRMTEFINIQGERLDGTNQLTREMALPLVVRGLGAPVEEKLVALGGKGELVVSIVVAMDNQKNKIKGTFFAIHGPICDLTLEADKVSSEHISIN